MAQLMEELDNEINKFRKLEEEMRRLQANQQKLMTQKNENELVRQELELATDDNKIYRLVGPVLTSQTKAEALETVDKRIQFISEQLKRLEQTFKENVQKQRQLQQSIMKLQQQIAAQRAGAIPTR